MHTNNFFFRFWNYCHTIYIQRQSLYKYRFIARCFDYDYKHSIFTWFCWLLLLLFVFLAFRAIFLLIVTVCVLWCVLYSFDCNLSFSMPSPQISRSLQTNDRRHTHKKKQFSIFWCMCVSGGFFFLVDYAGIQIKISQVYAIFTFLRFVDVLFILFQFRFVFFLFASVWCCWFHLF